MDERRRIAVVAALAVVSVALVGAVVLTSGPGSETPSSSAGPAPTNDVAMPDDRPPVAVRDFVFETANVKSPTAQKAQSKLWYAEGSWWAGLLSPATERIHIFRLDWGTQTWLDTGTVVDERPDADPDYLWTGDSLLVASAGTKAGASHGARIIRFHYDQALDRFVMDPDFPVPINDTGTNAIVIDRDSTGTAWVTYVQDGQVRVAHTIDGQDAHWSTPYQVPGSGQLASEDISSVVAFGPGRIGVMWSDQEAQRVLFAWHEDGADDATWSPVEVVTEGAGSADNHLNLATFERGGQRVVAAAIKTSLDTVADPNPLSPQILVEIRDPSGRWDAVEAGRVEDHQSRPILLVDEARRLLYVIAQSPFSGGGLYVKRSPLDDPAFETGLGEPFLTSETDPKVANATSTKQSISPETGMVVMASDDGTGRFLHSAVDLGGTPLSSSIATLERPDTPETPDIGPTAVINDEFDAWPAGEQVINGWTTDATKGSVEVAVDGGTHLLRHASTAPTGSAGSCKDIIGSGTSPVGVDVRFRVTATGTGEARLVSIRIPGGEIVNLRAEADGAFSYIDGARRVRTDLRLADGRWYRARLDIDVAARQTDFKIERADGTTLLSRSGVDWRTDKAGSPDRICFRASGGRSTLDIDRVIVTR